MDPPRSIFPDYVIKFDHELFLLAIVGWDDRVRNFRAYLERYFPSGDFHWARGSHWEKFPSEIFEVYDVILEVFFRDPNEAALFKLTWI